MQQTKSSRNPALDVVRIFALFCVIAEHFFLNSGYYAVYIVGAQLYVATILRMFFMICVPLFLMLSGYLMKNKKPTKSYYKKLIRILAEYLLASLFCMAYSAVTEAGSLREIVKAFMLQSLGILSFESARYSWYVKMYIGLFLLIPYLNVLYNGLQDRKQKQYLLLTMMLLTAIPDTLSCLRFSLPWAMTYNDPAGSFTMFPDWWNFCYPITYYFLGAYLREYPLELSGAKSVALILAGTLVTGTITYHLNAGMEFLYGTWQNNGSMFVGVQAVLVFNLLARQDLRQLRPGVQKLLAGLSELCFCAYLVSSVFDEYFYRLFTGEGSLLIHRLQYFFVLVPIVLVCSLATAYVLVSVCKIATGLTQKVRSGL